MRSLILLLSCLACFSLKAQVYLQIEKLHSLKRIKISEGTTIHFKTKEYKDTWRTEELERIIPEANTIVLGGNLYKPDEIHAVSQLRKPFLYNLGTQFQRFGLSLLVYGGIADLANLHSFGLQGVIISASTVALGTIMKLIFKKRVFKMGRNNRLKIVDTRMFIPDQ